MNHVMGADEIHRRSLSFPPMSGCAETRIAPKKRCTWRGKSSTAAMLATARIPTASPSTAELYGPSVHSPDLPSLQTWMVGRSSLRTMSSRAAVTLILYGSQCREMLLPQRELRHVYVSSPGQGFVPPSGFATAISSVPNPLLGEVRKSLLHGLEWSKRNLVLLRLIMELHSHMVSGRHDASVTRTAVPDITGLQIYGLWKNTWSVGIHSACSRGHKTVWYMALGHSGLHISRPMFEGLFAQTFLTNLHKWCRRAWTLRVWTKDDKPTYP